MVNLTKTTSSIEFLSTWVNKTSKPTFRFARANKNTCYFARLDEDGELMHTRTCIIGSLFTVKQRIALQKLEFGSLASWLDKKRFNDKINRKFELHGSQKGIDAQTVEEIQQRYAELYDTMGLSLLDDAQRSHDYPYATRESFNRVLNKLLHDEIKKTLETSTDLIEIIDTLIAYCRSDSFDFSGYISASTNKACCEYANENKYGVNGCFIGLLFTEEQRLSMREASIGILNIDTARFIDSLYSIHNINIRADIIRRYITLIGDDRNRFFVQLQGIHDANIVKHLNGHLTREEAIQKCITSLENLKKAYREWTE